MKNWDDIDWDRIIEAVETYQKYQREMDIERIYYEPFSIQDHLKPEQAIDWDNELKMLMKEDE